MRWPWDKSREKELDRQIAEAERMQKFAEKLADESRQLQAKLDAQAERNHFGEMLQEAMARKARRYQ